MKRIALLAAVLIATPAMARDALGIFDSWGAFRDGNPERCYAIAEPLNARRTGQWRAFASIAHWPQRKVRSQLHIRLSREKRADAKVTLRIGDQRWELLGGRFDAWGPSPRHDAFIVARLRSSQAMSVSSVAANGGTFTDTYSLKGAATAIDAAALGCARRR